jgi:hypothetical protein
VPAAFDHLLAVRIVSKVQEITIPSWGDYMAGKFVACLTSVALALASITNASASTTFMFRYDTDIGVKTVVTPPVDEQYGVGNDISAWYTLPTGRAFSKTIPVATHDVVDWRQDSGTWPKGISLDTTSGLMSGVPTAEEKQTLLYHGYDAQGHRIARASLNFTSFTPVGTEADISLYAHTGQYFYSDLPMPQGVTVDHWQLVGDTGYPAGLSMLGRAIQGTPTKAGTYVLAWRGFDFLNREVGFVIGDLLVEDGPQLAAISDQSIDLQKGETFDVQAVVAHRIGDMRFKLIADTSQPAGLTLGTTSGHLTGAFATFNTSASFRIQATDTADGTQSTSNKFTLSTKPATADLSTVTAMSSSVGTVFDQKMAVGGLQPNATWTLVSGQWPDGITMNAATGEISGTPARMQTVEGLVLSVSAPNMNTATSKPFSFTVFPEQIAATLTSLVGRTGKPFSTKAPLIAKGDVAPFSWSASTSLASGMTLAAPTGIVSSAQGVPSAGSYGATLSVKNGDGQTAAFVQGIDIYNPLAVAYSPAHAKRLNAFSVAPQVPDGAVVGTASFTLDSSSMLLPDWLNLNPKTGVIAGTPISASTVTTYGPFIVSISDESGEQPARSAPFSIIVDERDQLVATVANSQAQRFVNNHTQTITVANAHGTPKVTLTQGALTSAQSTLALDSTGYLVGQTTDSLGTVYAGLVATVTDDDDLVGKQSSPFSVTVVYPTGLAPLTSSLNANFKWTKGVAIPDGKLTLPAVSNAYGQISYAFTGSEPDLSLSPAVFPAGSSLTPSVVGTPSASGVSTHAFKVSDESGRTPATGTLTLTVVDAPTVAISDIYGRVGTALSQQVSTSNFVGAAEYGPLEGAAVPAWLSFNTATGKITGTPDTDGVYGPFTTKVTDNATGVATTTPAFTVYVAPRTDFNVAYATDGKPNYVKLTRGQDTTFRPVISGNIGRINWSLASGSLPRGIVLVTDSNSGNQGGLSFVSSTSTPGIYSGFTISAVDTGLDTTSTVDDVALSLSPTIAIFPAGDIGFPDTSFSVRKDTFFSKDLTATNTVGTALFSPTSSSGLDPALILSPDGKLSGAIHAVGALAAEVTVTDSLNPYPYERIGKAATITLNVMDAIAVAAPTASFNQYAASASSAPVVTNGIGNLTYAISPTTLPTGLTFHSATGIIDGTPTVGGTYPDYSITVTDAFDGTTSAPSSPFSIVVAKRLPLALAAIADVTVKRYQSIPAGIVAKASNALPSASSVTYSISPALPQGLALDAKTGVISGSSHAASSTGIYTITALDGVGGSDGTATTSFALTLQERDPLSLTLSNSGAVISKQWGNVSLSATVASPVPDATSVVFSISPQLPAGISLDLKSGVISGTPTAASAATTYTVVAQDGTFAQYAEPLGTDSKTFSLQIQPRDVLAISGPTSFTLNQYSSGSITLLPANVIGTAKWSVSPDLPSWLTATQAADGSLTVSGTPQDKVAAQSYSFTLNDDHGPVSSPLGVSISVGDRLPLHILPESSTNAVIVLNGLYSYPFTPQLLTENALGKVTWSFTGILPADISFDPSTGAFQGTVNVYGTFPSDGSSYSITATDEKGGTETRPLRFAIGQNSQPIAIAASAPATTHVGSNVTVGAPTVTNSIGQLTFTASGLSGTGLSIDPATGIISGAPKVSGTITATVGVGDITGRTAATPATESITVLPALSASAAARSVIVYNRSVPAAAVPSTTNASGTVTWSLASGTLPKGMTINPTTGAATGLARELGDFGPIYVAAVDSIGGAGGTATTPTGTFIHIDMNSDPIDLTVADYATHVGGTIQTAAPVYGNELGNVTFFSSDLAALGLSINSTTGVVSGSASTAMDVYVNISIKDSGTTRVTSKPMHLQVLPAIRVTIPVQVAIRQGDDISQAVTTDYTIGTASYAVGSGTWPVGVKVNPTTGALTGNTTAAVGTYSGLTIVATDTYNSGKINTAASNVFSIKVNPTDATPVISNIASTSANKAVLFTVGSAATSLTPTVVDSKKGNPWVYEGTVYSLNHDITTDTGLTFDTKTGKISGTPTKPIIYTDLVITVTSSQGDASSTTPFWFGVQPAAQITPTAGQKVEYISRRGDTFTSDAPLFDNTYGTVVYSLSGTAVNTINAATGITSQSPVPTTPNTKNDYTVTIVATDAFGRTGQLVYTWHVLLPFAVSIPTPYTTGQRAGVAFGPVDVPKVDGLVGTPTYSATGLPAGLTLNADGSIGGTMTTTVGTAFTATVQLTVKDSYDQKPATTTYTLNVLPAIGANVVWRATWDTVRQHATGSYVCLSELRFISPTQDVSLTGTIAADSAYEPDTTPAIHGLDKLVDGIINTSFSTVWCSGGQNTGPNFNTVHWTEMKFAAATDITSLKITSRGDQNVSTYPTAWHVSYSMDNRATWNTVWTGVKGSWGANETYVSAKP